MVNISAVKDSGACSKIMKLFTLCILYLQPLQAALKRGSSVVRHLPLVLEVPGSIPAHGEKNFGVRTRFL